VLDGPDSQIVDPSGNNALANLAANTATGSFTVQDGRNFNTAGGFTNAGTLGVGFGSTLVITGDYTQTANGVLNIELGGPNAGTDYDQLVVSGQALLAGTLNVSLINGTEESPPAPWSTRPPASRPRSRPGRPGGESWPRAPT
jgi:hypothetical protein